jgi:hypothetical protein
MTLPTTVALFAMAYAVTLLWHRAKRLAHQLTEVDG